MEVGEGLSVTSLVLSLSNSLLNQKVTGIWLALANVFMNLEQEQQSLASNLPEWNGGQCTSYYIATGCLLAWPKGNSKEAGCWTWTLLLCSLRWQLQIWPGGDAEEHTTGQGLLFSAPFTADFWPGQEAVIERHTAVACCFKRQNRLLLLLFTLNRGAAHCYWQESACILH